MVNLKSIISPTVESQLRNGKEMTVNNTDQKFGEFPPLDRLFEREDDPSAYKRDPILKSLIEHYQLFLRKASTILLMVSHVTFIHQVTYYGISTRLFRYARNLVWIHVLKNIL